MAPRVNWREGRILARPRLVFYEGGGGQSLSTGNATREAYGDDGSL
jgi:hypothetical protein